METVKQKVYEKLYLNPGETITECHKRIATYLGNIDEERRIYFEMLEGDVFRLNTPAMMNAGDPGKCLCACFITGLEDSMDSITEMWRTVATIYKDGGGAGIPITRLRERNAPISSGGRASGPLSYLRVVQEIAEQVKSGGKSRRAANLISAMFNHPDCKDIILAKDNTGSKFTSMNISVCVTDAFMDAVLGDGDAQIPYQSPIGERSAYAGKTFDGKELWKIILSKAWECGDPGLLFYDRMNIDNPDPAYGDIISTNPCVTADSRLLTVWGYKRIIDLYRSGKDLVVVQDIRQSGDEDKKYFKAVPVFMTSKEADVWLVRTKAGYELKATRWHDFYTNRGKIKLADMNVGDKVWIYSGGIDLPEGTDEDYAKGFILGFFIADGYMNDSKAGFCIRTKSEKILLEQLLLSYIRKYIDENAKWVEKEDSKKGVVKKILASEKLKEFVESCGVFEETRYSIPEVVWSGTKRMVAAFIVGYFAGKGTVSKEKQSLCLQIFSPHESFLKDLQVLLTYFGIFSRRCARKKIVKPVLNGVIEKTTHVLKIEDDIDINNFLENIGVPYSRYYDEITEYLDGLPTVTNEREDTVVAIEYVGREPVFDTTEFVNHALVFNGICTGNCGEVSGPDWFVCNLGHINLVKVLTEDYEINWKLFDYYIKYGVLALNRILQKTAYPHKNFKYLMEGLAPIGLGLIGYADVLILKEIPYDSDEAIELFRKICSFLTYRAYHYSMYFAQEKDYSNNPLLKPLKFSSRHNMEDILGRLYYSKIEEFKEIVGDTYYDWKKGIANSLVTCIAPTGSTALSCGASYSFVPHFSLCWKKHTSSGDTWTVYPEPLKIICERYGVDFNEKLLEKIYNNKGRADGLKEFPRKVQNVLKTELELDWKRKMEMHAVGQDNICMGISYTYNLPNDATPKDVEEIFVAAYHHKLKGVTVFRDGCLNMAPVDFGKDTEKEEKKDKIRPFIRTGLQLEVKTPRGNLYLRGNHWDGELKEIFLDLTPLDTFSSIALRTLGRIVSKVLQKDRVTIQDIIKVLDTCGGDRFFLYLPDKNKSVSVNDVFGAIGYLLENYLLEAKELKETDSTGEDEEIDKSSLQVCPACGEKTFRVGYGSCRSGTCLNPDCGYSACN